jgi:chemotaxis signal transduction protein
MAIYKGFEVDDTLYGVIRHMTQLNKHRDELQQQQISWDYLSVMAQLANLDNELSSARQQFTHLTGALLNRLGLETLNKVVNEFGFKAQVSINIMVRNLFERTADIGFLATDDDIRTFLDGVKTSADDAQHTQKGQQLRARFQEYVNKYSIYHDVILLDTEGRVLVQLDESNPVARSNDPIIKKALTTHEAYVESYGYSDLLPHLKHSLIYAYRVTSAVSKEAIGVICLCFNFENESAGIFKDLADSASFETLLLLNHHGAVIASSHEDVIALDTQIKYSLEAAFSIVYYNGIEYFCCARAAEPYQGYIGTGWISCVMVPLDKVFKVKSDAGLENFSPELLASAMAGDLFDEQTKRIPRDANQIQNELNRSVWNGNVQQASEKNGPDAAVSKVLLGEIKNTGLNTKHIFEESVAEIQNIVLNAALKNSQSHAALAIDMMDRNLYERANDCRWWALDTTFRELLEKKTLQLSDSQALQSILRYINGLYTVYTNLILFDKQCKVIAVSNPQYQFLVDTVLEAEWAKSLMWHAKSDQYAVSDFAPTALYDDQASYVFGAAIRSLQNQQVSGGIGIVFDADNQLKTMLQDVLPKNQQGETDANSFAVFVDRQKTVMASTSSAYKVGDVFDEDDVFFALEKGRSISKIGCFHQKYYAVGCAKSLGYREFKSAQDAYQQEVYAFVMLYIGDVQPSRLADGVVYPVAEQVLSGSQHRAQLATFYVGADWLGFKSEQVASAVSVEHLVPIHGNEPSIVAGYMMYKGDSVVLLHTAMLMGATEVAAQTIDEAVVIKLNGKFVALTIDRLGEMLDVDPVNIQAVGQDISVSSKVVREVVLSNPQTPNVVMLQMMDIALIGKQLNGFSAAEASLALV